MKMKRILFSLAIFGAGLVATHVAIAGAVVVAASMLFPARIYNAQNFPDSFRRWELVGAYLSAKVTPESSIAVGSSLTFGTPWMAEAAFPSKAGLLNVSVVGGSLESARTWTFCEMQERTIRAKRIVLEVPLVNELAWMGAPARPSVPFDAPCPTWAHPDLFNIALDRPIGAGWARALTDDSQMIESARPIAIVTVDDNYFLRSDRFEEVKQELAGRIAETARMASTVADEVYLFISPAYIPGIAEAGQDAEAVRRQFDFAQSVCEDVAGSRCIDSGPLLDDRAAYHNITHLSPDGHSKMAALVRQVFDRTADEE